jgi:hypothetical protein
MRRISTLFKSIAAAVIVISLFAACKDDEVKPDTATIQGTITMENNATWATWQDSGEVQVTIFPEFSLNPLAGWGATPNGTFPVGPPYNSQNPVILTYNSASNQYHYEITVDPGTYSALAVGLRHVRDIPADMRTATLGVYWDNPDSVSHGIVIAPFFNYAAPQPITVQAGDNVELNFKADFQFVEIWF